MRSVDTRVVQMEFDNKQFEAGAQQSLNTLEKLKQSLDLNKSAKNFTDLNNAASKVDLASLAANVESLSNRFSSFGIVGMTVLQRLTNAAMDLGNKLMSTVAAPLNQIKTGGWNRALNIENAMFKMSGLLKEEFEQNRELIDENINYAVSGTAYSYDAAANAMAQLMASNVDFHERNEEGVTSMEKALRGISGLAAMTNSDYSEIARIFTKVAGNGRLMTEELNQISGRGVNAAAALAEQLGVTEAEVRDMTTKGKIDFETFAHAMDDAFGEHAKKANETFTGALSNVKAALSRTGQGFGQSIQHWGRDILNAIRPNINKFNKEYLQPLVDEFDSVMSRIANIAKSVFGDGETGALNLEWTTKAIQTVINITEGLIGVIAEIHKGFTDIFPPKVSATLEKFFDKTEKASAIFKNTMSAATDFFKPVTETAEKAAEAVESVTKTVEDLDEIANKVIRGDFGNGQVRFDALEELGYNYKEVQNRVNELLGCSFRYEVEEKELVSTTQQNNKQLATMEAKLDAAAKATGNLADNTEKANTETSRLRRIARGIASALKIFQMAGKAVMDVIITPFTTSVLPKILDKVVDLLADAADWVTELAAKLEETQFFERFLTTVLDILKGVGGALKFVFDKVVDLYNFIVGLKFVQDIMSFLGEFFWSIPTYIQNAKDALHSFSETAKELFGKVLELPKVQKLKDTIGGLVDRIGEFAQSKFDKFVTWLDGLKNSEPPDWQPFLDIVDKIAGGLDTIFDNIEKVRVKVDEFITPIGESIWKAIQGFFKKIGKVELPDLFGGGLSQESVDETTNNLFSTIGEAIGKFIEEFNWEKLGKLVKLGSLILIVSKLAGVLTSIKGLGDAIKKVPKSISGVFDKLSKTLSTYQNKLKVETFKTIAEGVALLAGSLVALCLVPPDRLTNVIAGLVSLSMMVALIAKIVTSSKGAPVNKLTDPLNSLVDAVKQFIPKAVGVAAIMIGIAGSLLLMVMAIFKINEFLKKNSGTDGLKAFGAMLLLLITISATIVILSKALKDAKMGAGIGVAMIGLAASLLLMSQVIKVLGSLPIAGLKTGIIAIGLLMGGILALAAVSKNAKLGSLAAGTLLLAVALTALTIPLIIMGALPFKVIEQGLAVIAVAIVGLLALSMFGDNLVEAAGGMMVMALAFTVLAKALTLIDGMESVVPNLIALGLALAGLLLVVALVGTVFQVAAAPILMMSVSLLAISLSALAFAAAIYVFGAALPVLIDGIIYVGQSLKEHAGDIALGFFAIIAAIAAAIIASKAYIALAGTTIIDAIIMAIDKALPGFLSFIQRNFSKVLIVLLITLGLMVDPLVKGVIDMINKLAEAIDNNGEALIKAFGNLFDSVVNFIVKAIIELIATIGERIPVIGDDIGKAAEDAMDYLDEKNAKKRARRFGESLPEGISEGVDSKTGEATAAAASSAEATNEAYQEHLDLRNRAAHESHGATEEVQNEGANTAAAAGNVARDASSLFSSNLSLVEGLGLNFDQVKSLIQQMGVEVPGDITDLTSLMNFAAEDGLDFSSILGDEFGTEIPDAILGNTGAGQAAVQEYVSDVTANVDYSGAAEGGTEYTNQFNSGVSESAAGGEASRSIIDPANEVLAEGAKEARPYGESYTKEWSGGVEAKKDDAKKAMLGVVTTVINTVSEKTGEFRRKGEESGTGYVGGISSKKSDANSAGSGLKNSAISGADGGYDRMYDVGSNAGEGFYDGLSSWAGRLEAKARQMADNAATAAQNTLDEHSPSRRFRRIGEWAGEGFVMGLEALRGDVVDTTSLLANSSMQAMTNVVSKIAEVLENKMDYEPTIRPVMDLTALEEGAVYANGALASLSGYIPISAVNGANRVAAKLGGDSNLEQIAAATSGPVYNYTQNNYSPKALSRLEIYRQSRNLFAAMKGQGQAHA